MSNGIRGDGPYNQIREIMTGAGSEAERVAESKDVLAGALQPVADATSAADAAHLGFTNLREAGVPVSYALQVAGQAFDIAPHQVRQRIASLGDAIVRHAAGSNVRDLSTPYGAVTLVQEDITNPATPVDITVVPQKPWSGNTGGLVGAWHQHADSAGPAGDAIKKALATYDEFADRAPGQKLPPGYTLPIATGLDPADGPSVMLFATTIPSDEPRVTDRTAATRDDRMANLSEKVQRILIQLQQSVLMSPDLASKTKIRVAMPFLGTGPLGMVDTEECAAVMADLIGKFQQNNPQFEFVFKTADVQSDPRFADRIEGFSRVFTGEKTDIAPPRFQDARDLLNAATSPFTAPRKSGSTLDASTVDRQLDSKGDGWASKFLATLDKVPAGAFRDRGEARAYFKGNDKETFSMLHKLLEMPGTRKQFLGGDHDAFSAGGLDRQVVGKAEIAQLLQSPQIQTAAKQILAKQLPNVYSTDTDPKPGAFGGEGSLGEIMSSAVGSYLLATLQKGHETVESKVNDELDASQKALAGAVEKLGLSQQQVVRLRDETTDLGDTIRSLRQDIRGKDLEIADLEGAARRDRTAQTTRRTYTTSFPSASTGS